jgi:large subunit ribosomal protein L15
MDRLSNLRYAKGSKNKKKRVGRGEGSGHGGTATRGMNGQLSRSGAKQRAWFEGGQMPLQRRVPKYGFTSPFKIKYQVINVYQLQKLAADGKITDAVLTPALLYKLGLLSSIKSYKVLGTGELKAKINIQAFQWSASAKEKIEAAGGSISQIEQ